MVKDVHTRNIKLISIGNSKGIRIPKTIIQKYGFSDSIIIEEKKEGILLHQKEDQKLSWDETFKAMSQEDEQWEDFDITSADGIKD